MIRLFLIFVIVTQVGCAELIGYAIGTAGNVTGDLIVQQIKKMEDAENSPQKTKETSEK